MIKRRASESSIGPMEESMKDTGKMASNMAKVLTPQPAARSNKESGRTERDLNG